MKYPRLLVPEACKNFRVNAYVGVFQNTKNPHFSQARTRSVCVVTCLLAYVHLGSVSRQW
ncbi:hypothetical protein GYH30_040451 [Glycine max]|uniref:Uncharacterized protein n=1 Tax=Glycine max TaxID=3847 RepID=A0A0R0GEZ0_SOYBN|nr:hypothetical protein GYH30_040451 [Glycine max]